MKPALLVIGVQKEFFKISPTTAQSLNHAIEYINVAIAMFRGRHLPVICVQDRQAGGDGGPESEGFDLPDNLGILPSDLHISKTFANAFHKTQLADALRGLEVDTVIITGYSAEYSVLSTCRGAPDAGFMPILLRGALASSTPETIKFVENVNEIISCRALKKVLE
jgi:nicotinamidase-related amidase